MTDTSQEAIAAIQGHVDRVRHGDDLPIRVAEIDTLLAALAERDEEIERLGDFLKCGIKASDWGRLKVRIAELEAELATRPARIKVIGEVG